MLDTATAVYEAVEPLVVWRSMFNSLASSEATLRHVCDTRGGVNMADWTG